MKTNNRLSKDNTSVSVVKQHRPMVKVEKVYGCIPFGITKNNTEPTGWTCDYQGCGRCPDCEWHEINIYMSNTEYIEYLEKENQELKEHIKAISIGGIGNHRKQLLKDQFLKVVESVLNKAEIYHFDLIDLENGTTALNQPIITELIQEIKSAMEKGNND